MQKKWILFVLMIVVPFVGCKTTSQSSLQVSAHAYAEAPPIYPGVPCYDVHVAYRLDTSTNR